MAILKAATTYYQFPTCINSISLFPRLDSISIMKRQISIKLKNSMSDSLENLTNEWLILILTFLRIL